MPERFFAFDKDNTLLTKVLNGPGPKCHVHESWPKGVT